MKSTMAARIRALQEMTVPEMRTKYREVFGGETRSRHKEFLWKQISRRLQALEEGDLSKRARRRAGKLANDADVRIRAPRNAFGDGGAPAGERTRVHAFSHSHDARLPMAGTVITREYRGNLIRVTVLDRGFEHEGKVYRSLTALVREVTGSHWNGYHFFGLAKSPAAAAAGGG